MIVTGQVTKKTGRAVPKNGSSVLKQYLDRISASSRVCLSN